MKGSSGNAVKIVQNVLKINGYYFGSIDRFFGTMTDVAVRQLQISKALPQDGIVGYRTWTPSARYRTNDGLNSLSVIAQNP